MTKPAFDIDKNLEDILSMESEEVQANPESIGDTPGVSGHGGDIEFDILPEELEEYLNQYVVRQDEAIEVVATKVCTHFKRMALEKKLSDDEKPVGNIKSNMLLIGPTGVGKTYIIKLIAKRIGVPFVKADATKFSETGYVGGDVEDLVRELVSEAEGDIARAEYGIIYIDEIDKIASSGSLNGPDVSRSGVQRNLLKLMEDADVDLKTPHDLASQVEAAMEAQRTGKVSQKKINTRSILFIVSGAFNGLEDIVNKRLNRQAIGFEKQEKAVTNRQASLKEAKTEDLIKFGFESEFIGRLPVYVVLNDLDEDGLYEILKNPTSSVIMGKKMDFLAYGIDLTFSDDALKELAKRAYQEKTGARGLLSVFEKLLIPFEKTLPSTDIKTFHVDMEVLDRPVDVLSRLVGDDSIRAFQRDFLAEHGLSLEFEPSAVEKIHEMAGNKTGDIKKVCGELFSEYHHGMLLMKKKEFTIPVEAVDDPSGYMDEYIRKNYQS